MAGKPKKKAGKKVKPSRPALAVLWGLDPSFGPEAAAKGEALRAVLAQLGARAKAAAPEQLGMAAGAVAGMHGFSPVAAPWTESVPDCEFVLLCGFTNAQVSEFIARSREAGCVVGAKAVLTPQNRAWPLGRLINAVTAEHKAMSGE